MAIVKAFNIQLERKLLEGYAYYEFGLFKGFSFWFAEQVSREYINSNFYFYGFDSFKGLPKPQVDVSHQKEWTEGSYAASLEFVTAKIKEHGADFSRIKLYKGFFTKTFFDYLHQSEIFLPISICVIDSDLYESCIKVLDFIKNYLVRGSILLFDDYNIFNEDDNHGERRAIKEFEQKHLDFQKEYLFNFGSFGVAFRVLTI